MDTQEGWLLVFCPESGGYRSKAISVYLEDLSVLILGPMGQGNSDLTSYTSLWRWALLPILSLSPLNLVPNLVTRHI